MRLLQIRRGRLTPKQKLKFQEYLHSQPVIAGMYDFCQDLNELLRVKGTNQSACRKHVVELLEKITQLKQAPFVPLKPLGRTLHSINPHFTVVDGISKPGLQEDLRPQKYPPISNAPLNIPSVRSI